MRDVERQCGLVERAPLDADAGGFAAKRMPSVGADDEAAVNDSPCRVVMVTAASSGVTCSASPSIRDEVRQFAARVPPWRPSAGGFRCCSRTHRSDLVGREPHLRRADKAAGIVDEPHDAERGGMVLAAGPYVKRLAENRRAAEQRRRAVVAIGDAPRDQRRRAPAWARAMAAASPAGPPPTTAASMESGFAISFMSDNRHSQRQFQVRLTSSCWRLGKFGSDRSRGGTPQGPDMQTGAIPDSKMGK